MTPDLSRLRYGLAGALAAGLAGCISAGPNPEDPYEDFNRQVFAFNDGLDRAIIKPVAEGYRSVTTSSVREGVGNFSANLGEPLTAVNHALQGNVADAGASLGRFLINSTVGLAGVLDAASALGIRRTREDFGQTLGSWGVTPGPYLVLPLIGPTTPRDLTGLGADLALNPLNYPRFENDEATRAATFLLWGLNARADALDATDELSRQIDPYTTVRRLYGRTRAADIGAPLAGPDSATELDEDELDF